MSRSYKRSPVVKDGNRHMKRYGRRRFRARERQALRTARYDRVPVKCQEVSEVWNWADWRITGWHGAIPRVCGYAVPRRRQLFGK